jgi:hypothetical protein
MEAQAAAQQLAQAAAQQAVLGCRSPVSVFKHNILRRQMEAQAAAQQLAQAGAQKASSFRNHSCQLPTSCNKYPGLWIHTYLMRIRIQHFNFLYIFWIENCNLLIPRPP